MSGGIYPKSSTGMDYVALSYDSAIITNSKEVYN
jgi:hypothetical protein